MGNVWIKEFTGGLDARRLPETTSGGVLITASDGHITRGGEFEKRAAFVRLYDVPDTVGLAQTRTGIVVFGSGVDPGVPEGVDYQQLEHPTDANRVLVDVPSFDLYGGKLYCVAVYDDGSTHHFYDGAVVEDWFDGRARASFSVIGRGETIAAVAAEGAFTITGGTSGVGNEIASVTVNGVTITSGAVAHTGDNATTAAAVAADITSNTSSPDYTASADGAVVTITAAVAGAAPNGFAVAVNVGGDATAGSIENMAGGADAIVSAVTSITVDGIDILGAAVEWATSNSDTATAIAAQINSETSNPEYDAIAVDDTVVILADEAGEAANGLVVAVNVVNDFEVSPSSGLVMDGGVALAAGTFQPGTFVKTIDAKMYALSDSNMHFSGIARPTEWTTDVTGAGFINISTYASGSEELKAIAQYQNFAAVFSESNITIWFIDPDPSLYRKTQLLRNTGTISPHSVTEFGDADLFYLNESGIRSLRARDSSNAASASDLGVPVDTLIKAAVANLTTEERERISGLIEPDDGRFWLVVQDTIFVYTFFNGANISAWSTYTPAAGGEAFYVERTVVHNRKVYLRSTDGVIYVYGGLGSELEYDDTEAVARTPYFDAETPTKKKTFTGIDVACEGEWEIWVSFDPTNTDAKDLVARIDGTTYGIDMIPGLGQATHISLTFRSMGTGYAKLGACVIHYAGDADEG